MSSGVIAVDVGASFIVRAALCAMAMLRSNGAQAQQVGRAPVEVNVASSPSAMTALGRTHLVYELYLTNLGISPLRVESLELVDGVCADWSRDGTVATAQRHTVDNQLGATGAHGDQRVAAGEYGGTFR